MCSGELVEAAIERARLHERHVFAQEIAHRALLEPMPMQAPFASRRDQLIGGERLEHVEPARSLARGRKTRRKERVEPQLIPQQHRQPASAPLSRPSQTHLAQANRDDVAVENRRRAIFRKQRHLPRLRGVRVENLDRLAPRGFLAVVDLPQIENLPLRHPAVVQSTVLHHRPRTMLLAVLAANLVAQKHDAGLAPLPPAHKGLGRHYKPFSNSAPKQKQWIRPQNRAENRIYPHQLAKSG